MKLRVALQQRRFNVDVAGDDEAYAVQWFTLGERLLFEDWIHSYEGPWPAYPGLIVEVECDWPDAEVARQLQKIAQPYLTAAARRHKRGITTNLRYG